jgi:hypothetical protein
MMMLALVSAVLRVIGNGINLLKIIGGILMRNLRNIIKTKLANGVETLLVVGNLGEISVSLLVTREG